MAWFLLSFFLFLSRGSSSLNLKSFLIVALSPTGEGRLPKESPRNRLLPLSCKMYSLTIWGKLSSLLLRYTFIKSSLSTSRLADFIFTFVALAPLLFVLAKDRLIVACFSSSERGLAILNSAGKSCALINSKTMSSSSLKLHLTSKDVSCCNGGSYAMNWFTLSCIFLNSLPCRFINTNLLDIFWIVFSIDWLLLAIIFAFSEKKPPFPPSFSRVTNSEPVAMVFIVSEMVFFLILSWLLSAALPDSPHCDRIECYVFWTRSATLLMTDSKRWNMYK